MPSRECGVGHHAVSHCVLQTTMQMVKITQLQEQLAVQKEDATRQTSELQEQLEHAQDVAQQAQEQAQLEKEGKEEARQQVWSVCLCLVPPVVSIQSFQLWHRV